MANEFIARSGLKVLASGIEITGSSRFSTDVTSSGNIKAVAFYGNGQNVTGVISSSYATTASVSTNSLVTASGAGSTITFTKGDGSTFPVTITVGSSATASYVDYANIVNKPSLFSGSEQIDHNLTTNYVANQHIDHTTVSISAGSGLSGGGDITTTRTLTLDTSSAHFTNGVKTKLNTDGVISSSLQFNSVTTPFTGSFTGSFKGDGSGLTGVASTLSTAGTTGTGTINLQTQTLTINGDNGVTTNASGQTITVSIPTGIVSSSTQVDVRNTTGIATIATTGSNTFTGVQTISNTTNSTAFNNGALIVEGGVGIAKDVYISGALNVTGLLTVASMSTQYVTSSQYVVGDNKIIVNTDDITRFGGLSVRDSGSSVATASIYWDSLNHHFIYENISGAPYNSAMFIAGPVNTSTLGNEVGLTVGRVPVASGTDHIDSREASSSIRVDFPSRLTHVEAGLVVTGSITSSVGFSGDGSNLTGVVSTLSVTGSQGGQSSINLKTQGLIVSGTNGVVATVSGQTLAISGSNATTTSRGVASFTGSNFTVTDGTVSTKPINFNGVDLNLGSTYAYGLQNITPYGASTSDQVTLSGGAIISGILHSSATTTVPSPLNSVIATVATGSYDAAHFDYVLKSGANLRTGTVLVVWRSGTSTIEFTDTSTADIGDTLNESFTADIVGANVRLKLTGDSNTWTVKTSVRMI
jgi:hypothetical protein